MRNWYQSQHHFFKKNNQTGRIAETRHVWATGPRSGNGDGEGRGGTGNAQTEGKLAGETETPENGRRQKRLTETIGPDGDGKQTRALTDALKNGKRSTGQRREGRNGTDKVEQRPEGKDIRGHSAWQSGRRKKPESKKGRRNGKGQGT